MVQRCSSMGDSLTGLVLAAGLGTRMMPLSRLRPKVLLPLGATTLLDHAIDRLAPLCSRVMVNTHLHADDLAAHLAARSPVGDPGGAVGAEGAAYPGQVAGVELSVEDEPGLGTAGGVAAAAPLIEGADVIVVNGDTWAPGDLSPLVESWDRRRVRVVVAGEADFGPGSKIVASLMPWSAVADLEVTPSGLYEVCWRPLADVGRLDVVGWDGPVIDCATPADLLAANLAWSGGESVIGDGARVDGTVVRSVVWPDARVGPGEHLVDAIRTDAAVTVLLR